jgi:hypothetical protein
MSTGIGICSARVRRLKNSVRNAPKDFLGSSRIKESCFLVPHHGNNQRWRHDGSCSLQHQRLFRDVGNNLVCSEIAHVTLNGNVGCFAHNPIAMSGLQIRIQNKWERRVVRTEKTLVALINHRQSTRAGIDPPEIAIGHWNSHRLSINPDQVEGIRHANSENVWPMRDHWGLDQRGILICSSIVMSAASQKSRGQNQRRKSHNR